MNEKLSFQQRLVTALMLFGLFFGAGNIIFPVFLGQNAASQVGPAVLGFNITAVGLPLLAIVAMGRSGAGTAMELAGRAGRGFGYFFTVALYLTIGPLFATPRLATVSYEVGLAGLLPAEVNPKLALFIYSLLFFAGVLTLSLKPSKIMDWVGKYLTPTFLFLLAIILIRSWLDPQSGHFFPVGSYQHNAFTTGLLEGYNTMDSLAGLAFGVIVIQTIRSFGIQEQNKIAREVLFSGSMTLILMALIYLFLALTGSHSLNYLPVASNGGRALSQITQYYFQTPGQILLTLMMIVACLKTAVGLVVALSETFSQLPLGISQKNWAIIASALSLLIANIGLEAIIQLSLPVLMFLYPLAIVLVFLTFLPASLQGQSLYQICLAVTGLAAFIDAVAASPALIQGQAWAQALISWGESWLPFFQQGFGWLLPAIFGLVLGVAYQSFHQA
ncbi:branched-chain amino acid transport system II carrier protein [Hutsoniella sourekii]